MVGPVVKIDEALLPRRRNIHWLGPKLYDELPLYLAGWDIAILPFARNQSTRFISPTKTPEYLAAGRPVVSTPITDVVRSYGHAGLARIAETPEEFVLACEAALSEAERPAAWLARVDRALGQMSWDATHARMRELMRCAA
jgi:glycosyltransferase involved in cell wall biosynthesis